MIENGINKTTAAQDKIFEANQLIMDAVSNDFLYTWQWWLGICLAVFPWIIWFFFRRRECTFRLLLAGFSAIIITFILDLVGISNKLWAYPLKIVPSVTSFVPFTVSLIPVLIMLLIQFKPRLNPYIKAIGFSAVCAYLGLPLFVKIGYYKLLNWTYSYSFFTILITYLIAHWFSQRKSFSELN